MTTPAELQAMRERLNTKDDANYKHLYDAQALLAIYDAQTVALRAADERVCAIIARTKPTSPFLADLLEITYGLRDSLKTIGSQPSRRRGIVAGLREMRASYLPVLTGSRAKKRIELLDRAIAALERAK